MYTCRNTKRLTLDGAKELYEQLRGYGRLIPGSKRGASRGNRNGVVMNDTLTALAIAIVGFLILMGFLYGGGR